ncbi:beta/gamma crystallin-related protein [Ramlibacter alkalitolerans]|uniref:Glycine zipper 2TM domain-containing protein n=1 Tax=Ramlibacter alkalitolerans TaxID=2039631 RepID=A0ABS1JQ54_9BURK|nr:beta/gamma crystallin-related protein [Ramlibacter alkalitolerans]MBL0426266.1 glycine zipper 2TM domain-containing protein [Ramlibacter alkalitolerans]
MAKFFIKAALTASTLVLASQAMAQIVLYEREGFRGHSVVVNGEMRNLERRALGDTAASVVVERGRWEVCERPRYQGRCAVLRRGNYPDLRGTGLQWNIASIRPAREGRRYDFEPQAAAGGDYAYRRRASERTQEVPIRDVRAIMGAGSQRCWVERQAVPAANANSNVGGALLGAVVGGILGHQVGAGSGRDAATGVGAIAGAAVGNNVGRGGAPGYATQDVQRCETVQGAPAYYEVTYNFRGTPHTVQMSAPPAGSTIIVNERGEPRM